MMGVLSSELSRLLDGRMEAFSSALRVKGANDRVDALTLLCRDIMRASTVCYIDGELHFFSGRCYVPVKEKAVHSALYNLLIDRGASPLDVRRVGGLGFTVLDEKSFPSEDAVCFTNGVYDLTLGRFTEGFSATRHVSECVDYAFDPAAACPLWDRFLAEVLPDPVERDALMEFFSLCYVDRRRISIEKMAFFVGAGANGKSVIFEVVKRVLGQGRVSNFDPGQLADSRMLPYVRGKRLNFSPDVRKGADFDSALKPLASGQDVAARRIYDDAITVKCPPIVFALNDMPYFRDTSAAFFRRILLFCFDVRIPPDRQDKGLAARIIDTDLPGIFCAIMRARGRLLARKGEFIVTEKMSVRLEALQEDAVIASRHPVKAYLERRGLSVRPSYPGQPFVNITQNEIVLGLGGQVSRSAITRELQSYGIEPHRTREERNYRVFQIATNPK